jgi:hypothetical protein
MSGSLNVASGTPQPFGGEISTPSSTSGSAETLITPSVTTLLFSASIAEQSGASRAMRRMHAFAAI